MNINYDVHKWNVSNDLKSINELFPINGQSPLNIKLRSSQINIYEIIKLKIKFGWFSSQF